MLQNDGRRAVCEILKNIGPVIHVCQVGLAGMLARLNHLFFGEGRNNAVSRTPPLKAAASDGPLFQGVKSGGLVGVFAIAQALFLAIQRPYAFLKHEFFIAQNDGHGFGESVLADSAVHGLEIRHACLQVFADQVRSLHSTKEAAPPAQIRRLRGARGGVGLTIRAGCALTKYKAGHTLPCRPGFTRQVAPPGAPCTYQRRIYGKTACQTGATTGYD